MSAQTIHNTDPSAPRTCKICGDTKPLTDFPRNGASWWLHYCMDCKVSQSKDKRVERRAAGLDPAELLTCAACKEIKPRSQFASNGIYCKPCRAEQDRLSNLKLKEAGMCHYYCGRPAEPGKTRCRVCADKYGRKGIEIRNRLKLAAIAYLGGECVDCHLKDAVPAVFDFHHRDSEQKDTEIGRLIAEHKPMAVIEVELDRCELLCSNCHRTRHYLASHSWMDTDQPAAQAS